MLIHFHIIHGCCHVTAQELSSSVRDLIPIRPTMFFLAYNQESLPLHNQMNVKETQETYFHNYQTISCLILKPKPAFIRVSIAEPRSLGGWIRQHDNK